MIKISTQQDLNTALKQKLLLLACMQKGCIPCASVSPLLSMLSGLSGFLTVSVEEAGNRWLTETYAVDGSPTWLVFRDGAESARIDPAGKSAEELSDFLSRTLDVALSPASIEGALAEGRRQADYLESCLAELTFRRNETSEELLLASIRIKIFKACLACDEQELMQCVPAQIEHIMQRLQTQMLTPDGATEARSVALGRLPDLAEDYIRELMEAKMRIAAQGSYKP